MVYRILLLCLLPIGILSQTFFEQHRFGGGGSQPGQFKDPQALTVNSAGLVYVVDSGNHRLQIFDRQGKLIKTVGGFGFQGEQFNYPMDIWTKSIINVYVSDYNNRRVQRFDRNMNYISSLESNPGAVTDYQFDEVLSCAVNAQQDLFLLDRGDSKIIKFNRNGSAERAFGHYASGIGRLKEPGQLEIWQEQRLVVSDVGLQALIQFDFFGNFLRQSSHKQMIHPRGIDVLKDGQALVTDSDSGALFISNQQITSFKPVVVHNPDAEFYPVDVAAWQSPKENQQIKCELFIISGNWIIKGYLVF
ncbi:MAG: hypothetical protein GF313_08425 [Caldithrix sp.]|nr:hypothetical protein [Caldithrix sp.]